MWLAHSATPLAQFATRLVRFTTWPVQPATPLAHSAMRLAHSATPLAQFATRLVRFTTWPVQPATPLAYPATRLARPTPRPAHPTTKDYSTCGASPRRTFTVWLRPLRTTVSSNVSPPRL